MKDIFEYESVKKAKKERNLKSWAVKLPEEVIEELEKLYEGSGLRFKNEFVEHLIQQHKVNLIKEGKLNQDLIHPEIAKSMSSDIYELSKMTQMINSLFVNQLEKISMLQYEKERLEKQVEQLKSERIPDSDNFDTVANQLLYRSVQYKIKNSIYLGDSGSGKSYTTKLELINAVKRGKTVIVIDPQGEYKKITESLGGVNVKLDYEKRLSPFEIRITEEDLSENQNILTEKILELLILIEEMLHRDINAQERKTLLEAIENSYASKGITRTSTTENKELPLFYDLEKELRKMGNYGINLADELEPYVTGTLACFNRHRNVAIPKAPIITFDIKDYDRQLSSISMLIVLQFINGILNKGIIDEPLIIVDEAWNIIRNSRLSDYYLSMLNKHQDANFILTTQQSSYLLKNGDIINAFDTFLMFRTYSKDIVEDLKGLLADSGFDLTPIRVFEKGEAFLYKKGYQTHFVNFPQDKRASTNPNDLLEW